MVINRIIYLPKKTIINGKISKNYSTVFENYNYTQVSTNYFLNE